MKRTVSESLNRWKTSANRKPLLLRGARQVGKTYILKEFGGASFPRYHYVNFEKDETLGRIFEQDLNPARILNELQFYLERYRPPMAYVLSANNITQRNTVRYLPLYAAGRL